MRYHILSMTWLAETYGSSTTLIHAFASATHSSTFQTVLFLLPPTSSSATLSVVAREVVALLFPGLRVLVGGTAGCVVGVFRGEIPKSSKDNNSESGN